MWPIVMDEITNETVYLIGVFIGEKKPSNNMEFFDCLLRELEEIYENGSIVEVGANRTRTVFEVSKYLADTPARTWATGSKCFQTLCINH